MKPITKSFVIFSVVCCNIFISQLSAEEYPTIKQGLWVTDVSSQLDKSVNKMKHCVGDSESIKDMFEQSKKNLQGVCSEFKTEGSGSTYTSSITCDLGFSKMQSTSTATGDFSKEYKVTTKTIMTPAMAGVNGDSTVVTSKYVGDCEPGMKPGDMITSDGRKMNIQEMSKGLSQNAEQIQKFKDMSKNVDMQAIQQQMQKMMQKQ